MKARDIITLLCGAVAVVVAASVAAAPRAPRDAAARWERQADARLADHLFLEAQRVVNDSSGIDDYMMLLRTASALQPDDDELGAEYGKYLWVMAADSASSAQGVERMRRYFDANPGDYYMSVAYLNVARNLKDIPEAVRVGGVIDSLFPKKTDLSMDYADDMAYLGIMRADTAMQARAYGILDRIEQGVGPEAWIVSRKVRHLGMRGDSAGVLREVRRFLRQAPHEADNLVFASRVYSSVNMPDTAMILLNEATEADPSDGNAYLGRAQIYAERGDSAAYDREIFSIMELPGADVDIKTSLITSYVRSLYGDSTQADQQRIRRMFNVLTDNHPLEPGIRYLHGSYLAMIKDWKGAAEQFAYATDLAPDNPENWGSYVVSLVNVPDYPKAIETAKKSEELFPQLGEEMTRLQFYALHQQGKSHEGALLIEDYLRSDTVAADTRSEMLTLLGDTYYQDGDTATSSHYYEQAIEANPSNVMAMNNYAYHLAVTNGNLARALELATRAVNAEPDNPTYLDTYAWILFKNKNYPKAKEYIDLTLKSHAADSEDIVSGEEYEHAGDIYFMNGLPTEALEFWQKALEANPDNELLQRKVKHKTFFFE